MTNPTPDTRVIELTMTMEVDETTTAEMQERLGSSIKEFVQIRIESLMLALEFGGYDAEHPDHSHIDWFVDVQTHETRDGYWEWVARRVAG